MASGEDMKPKNKFNVSNRQWGKWTFIGRHVFNKTYEFMLNNPDKNHPATSMNGNLPFDEYKVIAWNAAFMAACVCSRGEQNFAEKVIKDLKGKK